MMIVIAAAMTATMMAAMADAADVAALEGAAAVVACTVVKFAVFASRRLT
jgi:hypothetical protein